MRFLLDESVDIRLGDYLSKRGHDVTSISRDYQTALSDRSVLELAVSESRVLITNDSDFGELVFAAGEPHTGVVLLRLGPYAPLSEKISRIDALLEHFPAAIDQFVVVTPRRVRVRWTRQ